MTIRVTQDASSRFCRIFLKLLDWIANHDCNWRRNPENMHVAVDHTLPIGPIAGCHRAIDLLKHVEAVASAELLNSHHLLIMPSSRNVLGLLDSSAFLFTETLAVGAAIPRHKHPGSEEILILQSGRSRVHLGDTVREVGAGATVFIPEDTWISAEVVGTEPVSLIAIFSEPGFEEYMRAISVREGQTNAPISKPELDEIRSKHSHAVSYK